MITNEQWLATWDTGASMTCISKNIIDKYKLQPLSYATIATAQGTHDTGIYLVDLLLPNNLIVEGVRVAGVILSGFDILIGMDIINLGDFAVSSFDGKTTFSFRIPSIQTFDFVHYHYAQTPNNANSQIGKNDPCPCGSGKKYKKCCGK
jgi:hypothetical protein